MGYGYQKRDHEVIDYQLYKLDDPGPPLRGPRPASLEPGGYFTCVGAAQTFGCYCERPYPQLLGQALEMEVINFGMAGVGPSHFLHRPRILEHVNRGCFAVVQLLSGRSVSNHLFESNGRELLTRRSDRARMGAEPMYRQLLESRDWREINRVLHDTRRNWVDETIQLLEAIRVPTVLLWFSVRTPEYTADPRRVAGFFGAFPQLVNREMVELVRPSADAYVECTCSDGLPQRLYSRFTGEPVSVEKRKDLGGGERSVNGYYPSPEMHQAAFRLLLPACRRLVAR